MVEEAAAIAAERGLTPFVSEQSQYSWLRREAEDELLPACDRLGVGFIPYFPLASGLLTGKYATRRGRRRRARACTAASSPTTTSTGSSACGRSPSATASRCSTSRSAASRAVDGVASVIAGATKPEQVRANAAAGDWEPTPEQLDELRSLL